jgi:S-formylglutathione hydrolase FrmB
MRKRCLMPELTFTALFTFLCYSQAQSLGTLGRFGFQGDSGGERRRADHSALELTSGARVEFSRFPSSSLKEAMEYSIFLPASYGKTNKSYPVVYFLHGLWNDHTSWTVERYGHLHEQVDKLITQKKIPEILMVHPTGDNSFYTNYLDGSKNYEDYVTQDLIQHIERTYRVKSGAKWRSIGGTSMGGFGALKIAFKFRNLYSATAAHSPIVFLADPSHMSEQTKNSGRFEFFSRIITPIFGNPVDQEKWRANNPLDLAQKVDLQGLRIYFDYGTADRYNQVIGLGEGVKALHEVLQRRQVPHTFIEHPNEPHGWELVSLHLSESLPFLCESFK